MSAANIFAGKHQNMDIDKENSKETQSTFTVEYDRSQLSDLLRIYYSRLFPFRKFYEWLSYDGDEFSNREFSFTLENDIYVRYQSFDSQESFEEGIKKAKPIKIDIGAIFSHKPKEHTRVLQGNFKAEKKELVFDIDMTDYDEIRTCCSGAQICEKCWTYMTVAIKIMDRALREDFGYSQLLWVYSGRRGVHCWVCDRAARELSQDARCAIVEYLTLIKGGDQQVKKVNLKSSFHHPSISSSLDIVDKYFQKIVENQGYMDTPDQWNRVLQLIPNKPLREKLSNSFGDDSSSWRRWQRMEAEIKSSVIKNSACLIAEMKLQYCYPRLDVNVSKGINHLLKSPLCIHPKTGKVCVPIDIDMVDKFDPFIVPTVSQICCEFEECGATSTENRGYKLTSLAPYMKSFDKFLLKLKKSKLTNKDNLDF